MMIAAAPRSGSYRFPPSPDCRRSQHPRSSGSEPSSCLIWLRPRSLPVSACCSGHLRSFRNEGELLEALTETEFECAEVASDQLFNWSFRGTHGRGDRGLHPFVEFATIVATSATSRPSSSRKIPLLPPRVPGVSGQSPSTSRWCGVRTGR